MNQTEKHLDAIVDAAIAKSLSRLPMPSEEPNAALLSAVAQSSVITVQHGSTPGLLSKILLYGAGAILIGISAFLLFFHTEGNSSLPVIPPIRQGDSMVQRRHTTDSVPSHQPVKNQVYEFHKITPSAIPIETDTTPIPKHAKNLLPPKSNRDIYPDGVHLKVQAK